MNNASDSDISRAEELLTSLADRLYPYRLKTATQYMYLGKNVYRISLEIKSANGESLVYVSKDFELGKYRVIFPKSDNDSVATTLEDAFTQAIRLEIAGLEAKIQKFVDLNTRLLLGR